MTKDIARYDDIYKEAAQQYVSEEPANAGAFISTSGGILKFGEDELPGNQLAAVVLDSIRENAYYAGKYNADAIAPPVCFAFGRSEAEMAPHPIVTEHEYFEPQHETCEGCPMNEFGSSDTGRGKACGNRRRLALVPIGFYNKRKGSRDFDLELFEDAKPVVEADIAFMKLPVTSVAGWKKYVRHVSGEFNRPPFGVATRIYIEPHAKHQFEVKFEVIDALPPEFAEAVIARNKEAMEVIAAPYSPPSEDDDE